MFGGIILRDAPHTLVESAASDKHVPAAYIPDRHLQVVLIVVGESMTSYERKTVVSCSLTQVSYNCFALT